MNNIATIIAAFGGTSAIAGLVAALTTYLKSKAAAEGRKKETAAAHREMAEDMDALRTDQAEIKTTLQTLVAENAALREATEEKDAQIAKLRKDLSNALILKDRAAKA